MSLPASGFKGASPGEEPRATTPGSACPARRALVLSLRLTGPPPPDATPSLRPGPQAAPPVGPDLRLAQTSSRWRCCVVETTGNRISATDASPAWQRHSLRRERWSCFAQARRALSNLSGDPTTARVANCQADDPENRTPFVCSPAVSRSTRLRRRIPGSPSRHLPAPLSSPTSFRRLRAAPAGSHPPPSPASHLALISQPEAYGRRPAGRVGSNPAGGRSHSGCGSSSGSSSSPRHPAPAPRAAAPRRPPEHLLTPFSPA